MQQRREGAWQIACCAFPCVARKSKSKTVRKDMYSPNNPQNVCKVEVPVDHIRTAPALEYAWKYLKLIEA